MNTKRTTIVVRFKDEPDTDWRRTFLNADEAAEALAFAHKSDGVISARIEDDPADDIVAAETAMARFDWDETLDGQIIIYTNLALKDGKLVRFDPDA